MSQSRFICQSGSRTSSALFAISLLRAFIAVFVPQQAEARFDKGEKALGPKVGYVSRNNSVLGGLAFQYAFSRHFRLSPEAAVVFRHDNLDALQIDINGHFTFPVASDRLAVYPLAGVNFTSWGRHDINDGDGDDVTNHVNRFGLNMGAGVELRFTSALRLSLEAKYQLMKTYPGAVVSFGIGYVF